MDIKVIPNSFMGDILDKFGVQWTHILIISGVVLSAFGFDKFIDPSIWILGIVGAFILVYVFRDYISGRFMIFVGVSLLLALALASPMFAWQGSQLSVAFAKVIADKRWITVYYAFLVGIPLGICLISYSKRPEKKRLVLPSEVSESLKRQILDVDFYAEKASYLIDLSLTSNERVCFEFEVRFQMVNRLNEPVKYHDVFDPAGEETKFKSACIGDQAVDVGDPDFSYGRGLSLSRDVGPRQKFEVSVTAETNFPVRSSELIGSYYPARELEINIRKPPSNLDVTVQTLLREKIHVDKRANGDLCVRYAKGILPFQGVRLYWEKRKG